MGILKVLGLDNENRITFRVNKELTALHPGISCEVLIDKKLVGYLGKLHPYTIKEYGISDTYVLEVSLTKLLEINSGKVKFTKFSTFPSSSRDISLLVKKEVKASDLIKTIKKSSKGLVTNVEIFDVYTGSNLDKDSKSVAVSLTYQAMDKTLTDNDINPIHQEVISKLIKEYNASIR